MSDRISGYWWWYSSIKESITTNGIYTLSRCFLCISTGFQSLLSG
nr:MAG TPA: hypothetical protein [Caudoviricetes sp.]